MIPADSITKHIGGMFEILFCTFAYFGYIVGWFGFREALFTILIMVAVLVNRIGDAQ